MTKNEREAKIAELSKKIEEHQKAIMELKDEIEALKSANVCSKCGEELKDDALFCPNCGERVLKSVEVGTDSSKCPQCGAETEAGQKFCFRCGYKLSDGEVKIAYTAPKKDDEEKIEPQKEEINEPATPSVRLCPKCGAELEDDSVFCFMCGTRV